MSPIEMPQIPSAPGAEALQGVVDVLKGLMDSLNTIASALPGGSCL